MIQLSIEGPLDRKKTSSQKLGATLIEALNNEFLHCKNTGTFEKRLVLKYYIVTNTYNFIP